MALTCVFYAFITFCDSRALEAFCSNGRHIPLKSVLVTFDDGNYGVYKYAYTLLKKRKIPFSRIPLPISRIKKHMTHGSITSS